MASLGKLLELLLLSFRFRIRRLSGKSNPIGIKAVVVDVDGTILENALPIEALKVAYGPEEGMRINKSCEKRYANGELKLDEVLIEGHKALIRKGFSKADWDNLIEKKLVVRQDLVDVLHSLQKKGVKVMLTTKGSSYAAERLSKKFKFDGAVGSEETFDKDGKVTGLKTLRCGKDSVVEGVKVFCGSDVISRKLGLDPKEIAFVYDEFSDIIVMRNGGLFVLAHFKKVPWKKLTDVSAKFKTYDIMIDEDNLDKLERIL